MREFKRGDRVVLLKGLNSYVDSNVPAGTKGEILAMIAPTTYRVIFDGCGIRHVKGDILSLDYIGNVVFKNETCITVSTIAPGTLNITSLIKDVIYNDPATIIFWKDGTKTVVKCDGEEYDPEKGFAMAVCKKVFGNEGNYYNTVKKWLPEEKDFKVGDIVKLSKEIYGMPVGTLAHIVDIDKDKENSYVIRIDLGYNFTVDKKYLRLV